MKIRQGFVSNSSSSSFIVVFPKVPENKEDVHQILFRGKEGGLSVYDKDGLSFNQISEIVYNDIKSPVTKDELIELFSHRYHYSPSTGNCTLMGIRTDELGGQWYGQDEEFWGTDKKLLYEFRDLVIEEHKKDEEIREKKFRIDKDFISTHPKPKCAWKNSVNPDTGKPFTKKEYDAYEKWSNNLDLYRKNSKEYQELEKLEKVSWKDKWDKQDKIRHQIAKKDVEAFLKTYKDKVIYLLNYGDNDGSVGCTMEHGDVFRNINHIRISNH
jgi:hypothetical protein